MQRFISVTNEQKNGGKRFGALSISAFAAVAATVLLSCAPAQARDLSPEFSARVWQEYENEVAAVSLNGKDLITFRARAGTGAAADEAEDLAAHLQDLVSDKNFDASQLLPAKDGDKATVRIAGGQCVSFQPINGRNGGNCMEAGLKVVNGIRVAMGAPVLPQSFTETTVASNASASARGKFSGTASWYGPRFHGRKTSDGHRFDMDGLSCAHRSLPFGTKLLVMNRKTGDSCVVEVNDRGPFVGNRVIDLSRGAARRLNMLSSGVAMVDVTVIGN